MGRCECVEAENIAVSAATTVAAVRRAPATVVSTVATAAALFCSQGGYGRGNDGGTIGGRQNLARCLCLHGVKDEGQDEARTDSARIIIGWYGSTATPLELGAATNYCRRLFALPQEFGFGGHHFFPRRLRYWGKTIQPNLPTCLITKKYFSADEMQT